MTNEAFSLNALDAKPRRRTPLPEAAHFQPSIITLSGFGASETLVYRTGGSKDAMKAALKWFAAQGRRLAKNPPKETGSQLLRKMRQGTVKS